MRQNNPYRMAFAIASTVFIIAVLVFFLSPVKAVDVVPQNIGYGYVAPPPPPAPPTNWWLIGGIVAAVVAVGMVIWLTVLSERT